MISKKEPYVINTFASKINKVMAKKPQEMAKEVSLSTCLSRHVIRHPDLLHKIQTVKSLPKFIAEVCELSDIIAIEAFRSPNKKMYLETEPRLTEKELRSIAFYHEDNLRVALVIFLEIILNKNYQHLQFFDGLMRQLIENAEHADFIKDLCEVSRTSVLYSLNEKIMVLQSLVIATGNLHYKNPHCAALRVLFFKQLNKRLNNLMQMREQESVLEKLPVALKAQVRFEMIYHYGDDIAKICTQFEDTYGEDTIWNEMVEKEFGPIILKDLSYQQYYGLKKWCVRTLEIINNSVNEEKPGFSRNKAVNELLTVLRELYIQGDQQAGLQYCQLAETPVYENCKTVNRFPVNKIIAKYILNTLRNDGFQVEELDKVQDTIDQLVTPSQSDKQIADSLLHFLKGKTHLKGLNKSCGNVKCWNKSILAK